MEKSAARKGILVSIQKKTNNEVNSISPQLKIIHEREQKKAKTFNDLHIEIVKIIIIIITAKKIKKTFT